MKSLLKDFGTAILISVLNLLVVTVLMILFGVFIYVTRVESSTLDALTGLQGIKGIAVTLITGLVMYYPLRLLLLSLPYRGYTHASFFMSYAIMYFLSLISILMAGMTGFNVGQLPIASFLLNTLVMVVIVQFPVVKISQKSKKEA